MNDTVKAGGAQVVLPNGDKRIEYIRDHYYGKGEMASDRPAIKNAINKMYDDKKLTTGQIPYQIVFSATKDDTDPRIASKKRKDEAVATKKAKAAATEAEAKKVAVAAAAAEAKAKK